MWTTDKLSVSSTSSLISTRIPSNCRRRTSASFAYRLITIIYLYLIWFRPWVARSGFLLFRIITHGSTFLSYVLSFGLAYQRWKIFIWPSYRSIFSFNCLRLIWLPSSRLNAILKFEIEVAWWAYFISLPAAPPTPANSKLCAVALACPRIRSCRYPSYRFLLRVSPFNRSFRLNFTRYRYIYSPCMFFRGSRIGAK